MRAVVAMLEGPAASRDMHIEFPDCAACPADKDMRSRWGCDGDAASPVFSVTCSGCCGDGCARCGGTGETAFRRCPRRVIDDSERVDLVALVRAAYDADELGFLPATGGMLDQTAPFVHARGIVRSERSAIQHEVAQFQAKERAGRK